MKVILVFFIITFFACSPKAKQAITTGTALDNIAWISGHWNGTAFGGVTEEIWSLPSGTSMMGMFKLYDDNGINFYELMTLTIKDENPHLRLKHFDKSLVGWEEKAEVIEFPFKNMTDDELVFDGISFKKISKNQMNVYVNIEGEIVEFIYHKK